MNKQVVIIGAGGHGKVIADIIRLNGDFVVGFLDDDVNKKTIGQIKDWEKFSDREFIVAIGDNKVRMELSKLPVHWYTAIHPSAVISSSAVIGEGSTIMPNAVVNADAKIGKYCIINSTSVIEHDGKLGDFVHISVGVKLGGTVTIGDRTLVGIGATVRNNISICEDCTIGVGAAVVQNITEPGIYVGTPAKKIETGLA